MALRTPRRKLVLLVGTGVVLVFAGAGAAVAVGADDSERPITGAAMQEATRAALAETGGGRVSETEVGDEDSRYEVEVTLDNGDKVDVQLDRDFTVVGTDRDGPGEDDGEGGDEAE